MIKLKLLIETVQLADKIYFKTNKLSDEDKNLILSVTNGDNYTKFISDIVFTYKNQNLELPVEKLQSYYDKII